MSYNVYSLPDTRTVLYHPDVGTANLHQCGHGKITVSAAGDLTSHTMTADGYVVVNKLKSTSGTITLEIPQNSVGNWFLRRWARWQKNSKDPSRIALGDPHGTGYCRRFFHCLHRGDAAEGAGPRL